MGIIIQIVGIGGIVVGLLFFCWIFLRTKRSHAQLKTGLAFSGLAVVAGLTLVFFQSDLEVKIEKWFTLKKTSAGADIVSASATNSPPVNVDKAATINVGGNNSGTIDVQNGNNNTITHVTQPVVAVVPQPDFIEGTEITHRQLKDLFPFGYTVFFYKKTERLKYEVYPSDLLNWKINWDEIKTEPDVSAGVVKWQIPPYSISGRGINITNFTGINFPAKKMETKFTKEVVRMKGVYISENPNPYIGTLNDNQRYPVFVAGMRIPTAQHELPIKLQ